MNNRMNEALEMVKRHLALGSLVNSYTVVSPLLDSSLVQSVFLNLASQAKNLIYEKDVLKTFHNKAITI